MAESVINPSKRKTILKSATLAWPPGPLRKASRAEATPTPIVTEVCQACHGADGNSPSGDFPRLGGQHEDYLAKALRDYKSGARKNPIMAGFAATLTNKDIDNLAAYYASQPAVVHDKF